MMNDTAISHDMSGNMTVDTWGMDGASVGMTDQGEALYDFGGVTMTAQQAEDNSDYFLADDDYEYDNNGYDGEYDDTLPDNIINGLYRINNVLGDEGAADFIADQLLGVGEDRMAEVLAGTNMDHGELQSYCNAIMIDLASEMGMDHNMLMDAMGDDINLIRASGSRLAVNEMHQVIRDAVSGHYGEAMQRWDRLRHALNRVR